MATSQLADRIAIPEWITNAGRVHRVTHEPVRTARDERVALAHLEHG